MEATRRGRGRPRKDATVRMELPTLVIPTDDAGDAAGALDALTAAESSDDSASLPATDAGVSTVPETALPAHAEKTRDRSAVATSPAPAAGNDTKRATLNGKQYRGLKLEQLRTLAAVRDNELAELRAQLTKAAPVTAAESDAMISAGIGETLAMIGDVAAMFCGPEARLTSTQKQRLGDIWAPALRPHLGAAVANMPLLAAISTTAGIVFEKYWTIKANAAQAAQQGVAA